MYFLLGVNMCTETQGEIFKNRDQALLALGNEMGLSGIFPDEAEIEEGYYDYGRREPQVYH